MYIVCFSLLLTKGPNLLSEEFEIMLLCLRLSLQVSRFIVVTMAFKKSMKRRDVLKDRLKVDYSSDSDIKSQTSGDMNEVKKDGNGFNKDFRSESMMYESHSEYLSHNLLL